MLKADNLYKILGVDEDADAETIKKAYRNKVNHCHPDKGGSETEFHRVAIAGLILRDPEKRNKYDEDGVFDDSPISEKSEAEKYLVQCYFEVFSTLDPSQIAHTDLVNKVKANLEQKINKCNEERNGLETEIGFQEEIKKRLTHKKETGILHMVIQSTINSQKEAYSIHGKEIDKINKAITLIDEYSYEFDFEVNDYRRMENIRLWGR